MLALQNSLINKSTPSNMQEKGLIFDIKRFSVNDGPGIRTTVFFKGCPLACWWCHNPESQSNAIEEMEMIKKMDGRDFCRKETVGRYATILEIMHEIEREMVFYESSGGGVTFSGGEPLMQPAFLSALADACSSKAIHTCLDTSGYADSRLFMLIASKMDLILFDIKTLDEDQHIKYTGVSNQQIIKNLINIDRLSKKFVVRLPLIPGLNNDEKSIDELKLFLETLNNPMKEIHILPYHPMGMQKYHRLGKENKSLKISTPDASEIKHIAHQFEEIGYTVRIGG